MTVQRARSLRKNLTDAERRVWFALRDRRFAGWKFRRQVPFDRYILDFVCFDARLVVEIDGGQHDERTEYDARRSAHLKQNGFRVLPFWNNEVLQNLDGVLTMIDLNLRTDSNTPSPSTPLPRGERGG
ncbi:MAG: endonuclease domain-containing protein [Reyranellaceae bacterium]